jgi:hypothetical protein
MAEVGTRQALDGGDADVWAPFEQAHNHLAIGANSRSLYLDGADLKLSAGFIGLYNGSNYYSITNTAAQIISLVGLTASRWAKVEIAITAGVVAITIASIAAGSSYETLPAEFTAAYNATKGGYYVTATKRVIGLGWINAAGACEGIVNTIGGLDGYTGYATSDDANDLIFEFDKLNRNRGAVKRAYTLTADLVLPDLSPNTEYIFDVPGGRTLTLPTLADNQNVVITIIKSDDNSWWSVLEGEGAETINGVATWYARRQYEYLTVIGHGTDWKIIARTKKKLDSGIISRSDWTNVHFGTCNIVHTDALAGTLTAANIINKKVVGGTTGTYGWVTGYDAGSKTIYLRDVYGTDIRVFDATENLAVKDVDDNTLDTLSFAAADWKNQDSDIYHGFGLNIFRIKIRLFCYVASITTALIDTGARELLYGVAESGANILGYSLFHIDTNSLQMQGASSGVSTIATDGSRSVFTNEDYAYRLTVEEE